MISKKIKFIIKVAIWGFILVNAAPQAVDQILTSVSTIILTGTGEALRWCGEQLWQGFVERGRVQGGDSDKIIGGLFGDILNKPQDITTDSIPGELPGNKKFREYLSKILQNNNTDAESRRIANDIMEKGYTIINRK